jgi:NADH-quinone oxidoreductase subunit M
LGGYGIIRFLVPLFHLFIYSNSAYLDVIAFFGCMYATLSALVQVDLKKIVAYSSIAHMSFSILGFFSQVVLGYYGALLYMFGHGFISAALFFVVGTFYFRWGTRLLKYYSGLSVFPGLSFFFLFFSFANVGFPGTVNFISESLIFISLIYQSKLFFFFMLGIMFVGSLTYSL